MGGTMRAWAVSTPGPVDAGPLVPIEREIPEPGQSQIRLRVLACGVCRTDLHLAEGDLPPRRPLVIPGHEIVGVVDALGPDVSRYSLVTGWAQRGSRTPVASVASVSPTRRTCVFSQRLPAGTLMAATPNMSSSMRTTSTRCPSSSTTLTSRRCCARASLVIERCVKASFPKRGASASTALVDRPISPRRLPSPRGRVCTCERVLLKRASSRRRSAH